MRNALYQKIRIKKFIARLVVNKHSYTNRTSYILCLKYIIVYLFEDFRMWHARNTHMLIMTGEKTFVEKKIIKRIGPKWGPLLIYLTRGRAASAFMKYIFFSFHISPDFIIVLFYIQDISLSLTLSLYIYIYRESFIYRPCAIRVCLKLQKKKNTCCCSQIFGVTS